MKPRQSDNEDNIIATCCECGTTGDPVDVFDAEQNCRNPECDPPKVDGMTALAREQAERVK